MKLLLFIPERYISALVIISIKLAMGLFFVIITAMIIPIFSIFNILISFKNLKFSLEPDKVSNNLFQMNQDEKSMLLYGSSVHDDHYELKRKRLTTTDSFILKSYINICKFFRNISIYFIRKFPDRC